MKADSCEAFPENVSKIVGFRYDAWGSFNTDIFVPTNGITIALHSIFDVAPWIVFGNNDDDDTNIFQRIAGLISEVA